jgi:opine dehydrogenase
MGPTTLDNRYMFEDIPMGLVPMISFGDALGVPMPVSKLIVELANIIMKKNYWEEGRNVEKLGLKGLSAEEMIASVL